MSRLLISLALLAVLATPSQAQCNEGNGTCGYSAASTPIMGVTQTVKSKTKNVVDFGASFVSNGVCKTKGVAKQGVSFASCGMKTVRGKVRRVTRLRRC